MKTQTNFSNLKKFGLAVLASVALVNGTFGADENANTALVNLEIFMNAQEEALKYSADTYIMEEAEAAIERVEEFVNLTESSLKYTATEFAEADARAEEIAPAMDRLEGLATELEASLNYQAPAEDQEIEAAPALERLEMMAEAAETSLKYSAPTSDESEINDVTGYDVNEMLAETK
jgi:hypothetical protein